MAAVSMGARAASARLPGEDRRHTATDRFHGPDRQDIADSAQLAINHINQGGGVKGCQLQFILRDDQGQPTVGVDAAKYLGRGRARAGADRNRVQRRQPADPDRRGRALEDADDQLLLDRRDIHDARAGRQDRRLLFRTLPTVEPRPMPAPESVAERGYQRISMIYINTDFGTGMVKDFSKAIEKLGGKVISTVAYDENQPSFPAPT